MNTPNGTRLTQCGARVRGQSRSRDALRAGNNTIKNKSTIHPFPCVLRNKNRASKPGSLSEIENGWNGLQENYKTGDADPFNNNIMNKDEFKAAANASSLFSIVVTDKKIAINAFITKYYSKEATFGDNSLEKNYQLFLNKYMYKDEDGNWKRNEDMWNKDKKGNFTTPKAPTN